MFPKDAYFICRRCLRPFLFERKDFNDITYIKKIGCPGCNIFSDRPGDVERFFKFYPRFTDAIEQIKDCGFEFVNYKFEVDDIRIFWIKEFEFKCKACGSHTRFPLRRLEKFADEPGLFVCKKCHIHPKSLKKTKDFFVSFRWVYRSALNTHDFLWDIISPLQLSPEEFPIQRPRYQKEHQE